MNDSRDANNCKAVELSNAKTSENQKGRTLNAVKRIKILTYNSFRLHGVTTMKVLRT